MKYKVEFWPYGEFDTAEAAERLNRRAGEGWELVNISGGCSQANSGFAFGGNIALYRRNPAAEGYRYTADIVPLRDREDYLAFCGDAGWDVAVEQNNGVCLFVSKDGKGRPLHTNKEVECSRQLQVLEENHISTSMTPYLMWIAVVIAFLYWLSAKRYLADSYLVSLLPCYAVLWLLPSLLYCVNLFQVKRGRRRLAEGREVRRPRGLAKLYGIGAGLIWCVYLYVVGWACFAAWTEGASLLLIGAALILVLTLTVLGIWIQLFKCKMGLGYGLILAGFFCSVIPIIGIQF